MALIGQKLAYPFNWYAAKPQTFCQTPPAVPRPKSQEVLRRNGV
jgi:hypothetical protein